ncbi:putative bifunctional diguanylate cyclase/phosphodiesterase [Salibacterium sp. K-3]
MEKGENQSIDSTEDSIFSIALLMVLLSSAAGVLLFYFVPPDAGQALLFTLIFSMVLFGWFHPYLPWNSGYYISLTPVIFYGSLLLTGPADAFFSLAVSTAVLSLSFYHAPRALTGVARMAVLLSISGIMLAFFQEYSPLLSFENPSSLIITAFHLILSTLLGVLLFLLWQKVSAKNRVTVSLLYLVIYISVFLPSFVMAMSLFYEALGSAGILFFDMLLLLVNLFLKSHYRFYNDYYQAAYFDELTGLPNAKSFDEHQKEWNGRYYVFLINIDEFKRINSYFGREGAAYILISYASRLLSRCGSDGRVYRINSDEFVIVAGPEIYDRLKQMLPADVNEPFLYHHEPIYLEISIGVSEHPASHRKPAPQLLQEANMAMQKAKETEGSSLSIYTQALADASLSYIKLQRDLHHAVQSEELYLIFQPQLSVTDGTPFGFEALLRWEHPDHGYISPGEFIPAAENSSLIHPLGRWVLKEACRMLKERQDYGKSMYSVSVNVSFRQFHDPGFEDYVIDTLTRFDIDPRLITLELTESATIDNLHDLVPTLTKWKETGIRLALDDFGSGYSSMNYIGTLPFDLIKIDRSFIQDLPASWSKGAIVRAVVTLAHDLNMKVIAEGVETMEQWHWLHSHSCDAVQGFLIGRGSQWIDAGIYESFR